LELQAHFSETAWDNKFRFDAKLDPARTGWKTKKQIESGEGEMAEKKEKMVRSKVLYRGTVFGVRRDEIVEPDGLRAAREVISHPGSVVVLPLLDDGRIVMVRQYRHAARQYLWELVAGRMDEGETVKQGAARELREETGYRAKRFTEFLDVFPTPGFLEERMHILLAEGLTAGKAEPEEDEKIISHAYRVEELKRMMQNGKLRDGKSIAGILYYLTFLRQG
jgi:ADP-ribose diphosphatase